MLFTLIQKEEITEFVSKHQVFEGVEGCQVDVSFMGEKIVDHIKSELVLMGKDVSDFSFPLNEDQVNELLYEYAQCNSTTKPSPGQKFTASYTTLLLL